MIISSCKKDSTETPQPASIVGNLTIQFSYSFDSLSLQTDTIRYTNAAGYKMSISRLQYFLSDFVFIKSDGSPYPVNQVYYLDAKDPNFSSITFTGIPNGNYKGMSFIIGLDTATNKSDYLPATAENTNMFWPTTMGGGYHFMKLEGNFIDSTGTWGYNMHIGSNGNIVNISLPNKSFSINNNTSTIQLKMNVSEWFKNPSIYDFDIDGVYSMGNAPAMLKLKNNGVDVFN
jgi:hypothetical protein